MDNVDRHARVLDNVRPIGHVSHDDIGLPLDQVLDIVAMLEARYLIQRDPLAQ